MRSFISSSFNVAMLAAGLSLPLAVTAETPDGHALYQENCTSCHGSEVFTRDDRKITSMDTLASQVRLCEQNLGLTWFDDEIDSVVTLLNQEYYHFSD